MLFLYSWVNVKVDFEEEVTMAAVEGIKDKYKAVGNLLEDAVNRANMVELVGEEENAELEAINSTLQALNLDFKAEIDKLEASSEWDKFCITFFGETNAGKSTIIESLRIIYDEEKRRQEIEEQDVQYAEALTGHNKNYEELIEKLKEINTFLATEEGTKAVNQWDYKKIVKRSLLVILGFCVGFIVAYFGF